MSIESKFVHEFRTAIEYPFDWKWTITGSQKAVAQTIERTRRCAGFVTKLHINVHINFVYDNYAVINIEGAAISDSLEGIQQTIENLKQLQQG